jgi:hypothetical protein
MHSSMFPTTTAALFFLFGNDPATSNFLQNSYVPINNSLCSTVPTFHVTTSNTNGDANICV